MTRTVKLVAAATAIATLTAGAAPVLHQADVEVVFAAPTSCTVSLRVEVAEAGSSPGARAPVEHRLDAPEAVRVTLVSIDGATTAAPPRPVGTTRALTVVPVASAYSLRYDVTLPATRAYRCPIWLPTTPTDGRSSPVRLTVRVPPGTRPTGTMPALAWAGEQGTARLGHLPASVHVPFSAAGAAAPLDIARLMDLVALTLLAAATLFWGQARLRRI